MEEGNVVHMTLNGIKKAVFNCGTFPNDYKAFLLLHNRMEMFDGIELLSTEGMIGHNEVQDFPEGYLLIRYHLVL